MTFSWAFLVDSVPFTRAVIAGETSLGGSESSCLGLARALKARGHDVHIFATKLADDAHGADATGVLWHPMDDFVPMNRFIEWDVVVSLRQFAVFAGPVQARLRLLWSQDLLVPGAMQAGVMSIAWALDHVVYVSEYHRRQWEQLQPELAGIGWVTKNGYDPAHVPPWQWRTDQDDTADGDLCETSYHLGTGQPLDWDIKLDRPADYPVKHPNRIIHISRPERGLGPLLTMWPRLKTLRPDAELYLCRYSSMYDQGPGSWSDVCASWDAKVAEVNAAVGGITYLGELTKPALYRAIAEAAVMWYPGVSTFAETSCIAAIEAQACGTPFVGAYRGALPETVPNGLLDHGVLESDIAAQERSLRDVAQLLDECAAYVQPVDGRRGAAASYEFLVSDGAHHVRTYTYAVLAEQWESQVSEWFGARYRAQGPAILKQLLHEDDHVAAKALAIVLGDEQTGAWCDYVIAGKDQTDEQYGNAAIQDPLLEVEHSTRFAAVSPFFTDCASILDVACGNGSFAIKMALDHPTLHVHGLDYAAANITRAREAAERAGVADRCTFERLTVYDFDQQQLHADMRDYLTHHVGEFDGLFVGEFIEHVGNYRAVIDGLEPALCEGATVVYTCPQGACAELVPRSVPLRRGHVHRFHHDDVAAVWGVKKGFRALYLDGGWTERGHPIGNWLIRYEVQSDRLCGRRPLEQRILTTRPLPRLTVGIIAKDEETTIGRCLESIWRVADEILVGDTGSRDGTRAIAESYGATVLDLPAVQEHPEGFAGVRNAVLERATGDWFLWIDCDEHLVGAHRLRRYLDGAVFHGYVIRQTHLYLDGPPTQDIPVRLFRHTGRVRFYGCIHEQPQDGDANADIHPTLDAGDMTLAHTGYLTQGGREEKRVHRNRPLLIRDQHVFPQRTLGKVLCIREAVIEADAHRADAGGMTERAQQGYQFAIQMFVAHFDDPGHKYHGLARPWYEAALRHLGVGWEVETSLAGRQGGLGATRAKPERIWVRDQDEFQRVMVHRSTSEAIKMAPVRFITDPDELVNPTPAREEVTA